MQIHLVAIDLYGTLVGPGGGTVSPENQNTLKGALNRGVKIALVTGLNRASALNILETSGIFANPDWSGLMVACFNGAVMFEFSTNKIIWADSISVGLTNQILKHPEMEPYYPMVHGPLDSCNLLWIQQGNHPEIITHYLNRRRELLGGESVRVVDNLVDSITFPVQCISVVLPEDKIHLATNQLSKQFTGNIKIVKSQWKQGNAWIEILPPQTGKGEAVHRIRDRLGLTKDQVMAIGDNWNDIEMFEQAGISVAMGNASDDVKQHATHVTLPWDQAGVARALSKWMF
jgi:Cof subfamily protein (haloacid dehalogenase superfamily)